jgi:CheY-like chemotaxis protein
MISADTNYYLHKEQILASGAAVFLTKPFSPAQLLGTIHRLLPPTDVNG